MSFDRATYEPLFSLLAIAISSLFLYLVYVYFWRPAALRRVLLQQGFTVLPYRPITGDLPQIAHLDAQAQISDIPSPSHHHLLHSHVLPFHHHLLSKHGGSKVIYWWGNMPTLLVSNVEDMRNALTIDVKQLEKPESSNIRSHQLLGKGLLLANGEDWLKQRNIVRPAFFIEKLKDIVGKMVTSSIEMVEAWETHTSKQDGIAEIEVARDIKNVTADILARSSFGSSYRMGKAVFERQEILLDLLSKIAVKNSVIPFYKYIPTTINRKVKELERKNNMELSKIIESRRKGSHEVDLLSLILAAEESEAKLDSKRPHLTTQQVIDECKTFFFAGHETTANLLAWTLVLLSLNQEWQHKARHEVLEVCGTKGEPKADHLHKLKVVGMILNESLRLYPPVPQYGRRSLLSNVKMGGGQILPKGAAVSMDCLWIHRDKAMWGEDANEFKPNRFENGVSKACKDPHAFVPFGMGPRICIGQNFAIMEAKVILCLILRRFSFDLSPNYRHAPVLAVTMRPKYGVHLTLKSLANNMNS